MHSTGGFFPPCGLSVQAFGGRIKRKEKEDPDTETLKMPKFLRSFLCCTLCQRCSFCCTSGVLPPCALSVQAFGKQLKKVEKLKKKSISRKVVEKIMHMKISGKVEALICISAYGKA